MTLEVRPPPAPDLPQLPRPPFLHAVLTTPADQTGACRFSSLFARPSPVNRRVGIHDFTFEACSSFTRVTACKIARPPKGGLLSRGFDPASYPTKPLGSYHVLPTTTCVDPPSTGDLRRWGALLTKCRSGRDKRRAGLGRLHLSVPAASHRTGLWLLPLGSENAKTACIMGVFRGFEAASRDLLTG